MCIYIYIYHTSTIKTCLEIEIVWNLRGTSRAPEEGTRKQQSATTSMQLSANLAEPMPGGRTCPETRPDSHLSWESWSSRASTCEVGSNSSQGKVWNLGRRPNVAWITETGKLIDKSWFATCRKCGTSLPWNIDTHYLIQSQSNVYSKSKELQMPCVLVSQNLGFSSCKRHQRATQIKIYQGYHDRKEHKITGKVPLVAKDHSERREWQEDEDASAQKQSIQRP